MSALDREKEKTFKELGIDQWLIQALHTIGITQPTEIQQACIPPILSGSNVIGSAKTGSGKTATFALPILKTLAQDPYGVYALVLTPTRELAFQIAEQFRILGHSIHLKVSVIVGGLDMMSQAIELGKKPHIIIATPGRLVDHIHSSPNVIHFKRIRYLVLDEADRMMSDSFASDLQVILQHLPVKRQNLMFTATLTPEIEAIQFSKENPPFIYKCNSTFDTVDQLDQRFIFIPSVVRDVHLIYLLKNDFMNKSMIIFTGKCKTAEYLRLTLYELGIRSTSLHSQMSQPDRLSSLAKFKSNIVNILITTDVGSRGLDIPQVQLVVNYEVPADASDYIHRIGRTARAGRGGMALSLVTEKDVEIILCIEELIQKKLTEYPVEESLVLDLMNQVALAKKSSCLKLQEIKFGEKSRINRIKKGLFS